MYVQIDYVEGNTSLHIEGLGPYSIIGIVKDAVLGHFFKEKPISSIHVGFEVINTGSRVQ